MLVWGILTSNHHQLILRHFPKINLSVFLAPSLLHLSIPMDHDAIYTTSAESLFLEHTFVRLLPNMVGQHPTCLRPHGMRGARAFCARDSARPSFIFLDHHPTKTEGWGALKTKSEAPSSYSGVKIPHIGQVSTAVSCFRLY